MKEKINNLTILQLALVVGITVLAFAGVDGWLVFALFCTL